jgi:xanthine phosphoribosyltransferase
MKALEDKIRREGQVLPGDILKVGSFLNQQLDCDFLMEMGHEIARLYEGCGVTKIMTVEASGIAIAVAVGAVMHLPVVFAKKNRSGNVSGDIYTANVMSFTHGKAYDIMVAKEYLHNGETILIVDDFLACGNALKGLIKICNDAGANVAGCAIAIEKGFQHGGDELRESGIRVESLAIVDSMEDCKITYRH